MASDLLIWIPLLPLLGAAFNLLIGRGVSRTVVSVVSCGSVAGALGVTIASVLDLWPIWSQGGTATPQLTQSVYQWISVGILNVDFGLVCDPLTAVMLVTITLVGFLIHVYSTEYMAHDPSYSRFFGYLNLFTGSMLILVLGDSLPVMFVGWEGVGVCSYLLIGFWYDKSGVKEPGLANACAGRKAFIVNRIGDLAFIVGMFVLLSETFTLKISGLAAQTTVLQSTLFSFGGQEFSVAGVAALLLFIGATGKSAQIPLYVWLPDAMAGPTPVSALIHAATMVTAGVYMVARMNFLYMLTPHVMGAVALIGALTAFFAATIGTVQNDIKKVLAYSTVSQLGYMFMAVGVGAFAAGIFHVFTHAFFKACLFLGAGAVIHALHDEQDIRRMGGLRRHLPVTALTFFLSCLAIAGIPFFAGFFSKDEILWKVFITNNPGFAPWFRYVLYVLGVAGAVCTAFYMFRLYYLTFEGSCRLSENEQRHIHAPGVRMRFPLSILAFGAVVLGFLGLPSVVGEHANFFHRWLEPVVDLGLRHVGHSTDRAVLPIESLAHNHALEIGLMVFSVVVAVTGVLVARRMYSRGPSLTARRFSERHAGLHGLLFNKYFVDEVYAMLVVAPVKWMALLLSEVVDRFFIDTIVVRGASWIVDRFGRLARRFQNGNLQHYTIALLVGLAGLLYLVSKPKAEFALEIDVESSMVQLGSLRLNGVDEKVVREAFADSQAAIADCAAKFLDLAKKHDLQFTYRRKNGGAVSLRTTWGIQSRGFATCARRFLGAWRFPGGEQEISGTMTVATRVGQRVRYRAVSREGEVRSVEYRWDLDGDGAWDVPGAGHSTAKHNWSQQTQVSKQYEKPGRYLVVLRVRDKNWTTISSATRELVVEPLQPLPLPTLAQANEGLNR